VNIKEEIGAAEAVEEPKSNAPAPCSDVSSTNQA